MRCLFQKSDFLRKDAGTVHQSSNAGEPVSLEHYWSLNILNSETPLLFKVFHFLMDFSCWMAHSTFTLSTSGAELIVSLPRLPLFLSWVKPPSPSSCQSAEPGSHPYALPVLLYLKPRSMVFLSFILSFSQLCPLLSIPPLNAPVQLSIISHLNYWKLPLFTTVMYLSGSLARLQMPGGWCLSHGA